MPTKLLLAACIGACLSITNINAQKISEGSIPPEYKCPDCVLVILKKADERATPDYNKNVEKQFKKYYTGKIEMVTAKELETDSKYQDKNIYRFVLNDKTWNVDRRVMGADGRSRDFTKTYISFYLYDRLAEKGYPEILSAQSGLKTLERTAKALDERYN